MNGAAGSGSLHLGGCLRPRSVPRAVGVLAVAVVCPYPDVVVGVVLEVRQGMGGRGGMGVAGFRRVGRVVLGALGPVDVVVRRGSVWSRWGFPSEHELAGVVVGGREGVYGSRWRVWARATGSGVGVSAGSPATVMVASAHGPPQDLPSCSPL